MADSKSAPQPPWEDDAGDSEGAQEALSPLTPERDLPSTLLWAQIPPAVRRLEEGGAGEDKGGLVNDCTDRVMGLLGMGHRLFVPRLLAVRGRCCKNKPPSCLLMFCVFICGSCVCVYVGNVLAAFYLSFC